MDEKFVKLRKLADTYFDEEQAGRTKCRSTYQICIGMSVSDLESDAVYGSLFNILRRITPDCKGNLVFRVSNYSNCSEKDSWDEKTGHDVARSKNELSANKIFKRVIDTYHDRLTRMTAGLSASSDKVSDTIDSELVYMEKLGIDTTKYKKE